MNFRAPRSRKRAVVATCAAGLAALGIGAAAQANPAGRSTLQETVRATGTGAFKPLTAGPGEAFRTRSGGFGGASATRAVRRRSIAFFAQITDPQIADEMSPARVDFVDPAGGNLRSSHRPQEALGLQTFDQVIRNVNANRTSRVRAANGSRSRLSYAITTGDLADNQQLNETQWFIRTLDGGPVDPFSGKPLSATNPCNGASADDVARINDAVANRRYTGLQDYADYPGAPPDRYQGFWDPNVGPPGGGPYAAFPRYPGLMDRAQRQFNAQGLQVPWFTSRGNHDGLIQGNVRASNALFRGIATGCLKVFPSSGFNPNDFRGLTDEQLITRLGDPALLAQLLAGGRRVPPDPDRRFVSKAEYKQLHGPRDNGHGFGFVSPAENSASAGTAQYYAYNRGPLRMISLDTVAEGGGQNGNIDDPQFRWLERELDRASSTEIINGRVRRDGGTNQLIVVYGHHTLGTMSNTNADEGEACNDSPTPDPGCDRDPRTSTPLHRGLVGSQNLRTLFAKYPGVVAYVAGHTHSNGIKPFRTPGITTARIKAGFWEINTASHTDFPQQSRLIEAFDNRDGTLSLFGTILDSASPQAIPASGAANPFTDTQLGSISRTIAANDPQREPHLGSRLDRNVELLVNDPRQFLAPRR